MDKKAYITRKSCARLFLSAFMILAVCLLSVFCPIAAFADDAGDGDSTRYYINDIAGLLTMEEDWSLENKAAEIADTYGCGVYVLTIDDEMQGGSDIFDYAQWYYGTYGLGKGEDKSGTLLVINSSSREFATYFYGETADYAFDSYGQEKLEDYFLSALHENEWLKAMEGFVTGCGEYLQLAAEGNPVRKSPAGMIAICIGASCLISLLICLVLRSRMKSVHIGTGASNYTAGDVQLSDQYDRYTHTTQTRTRIEKESDSGTSSSARTGSSGGSGRSGSF